MYKIEQKFIYGWDDAGWTFNDNAMRFRTHEQGAIAIAEFVKDADHAFGVGHYTADEYRAVLTETKTAVDQ